MKGDDTVNISKLKSVLKVSLYKIRKKILINIKQDWQLVSKSCFIDFFRLYQYPHP